jgi:hypothetical protein
MEVSCQPHATAALLRRKYPRYSSSMRVGGPQRRSARVEEREFCCTRGLVAIPNELLWLVNCMFSVTVCVTAGVTVSPSEN